MPFLLGLHNYHNDHRISNGQQQWTAWAQKKPIELSVYESVRLCVCACGLQARRNHWKQSKTKLKVFATTYHGMFYAQFQLQAPYQGKGTAHKTHEIICLLFALEMLGAVVCFVNASIFFFDFRWSHIILSI